MLISFIRQFFAFAVISICILTIGQDHIDLCFFVGPAFSQKEEQPDWSNVDLTHKSPKDSVDWSHVDATAKSPKPKESRPTEREWPGEKEGLHGPVIAHGGKGKDEAVVVIDPNGPIRGVITKNEAKQDPDGTALTLVEDILLEPIWKEAPSQDKIIQAPEIENGVRVDPYDGSRRYTLAGDRTATIYRDGHYAIHWPDETMIEWYPSGASITRYKDGRQVVYSAGGLSYELLSATETGHIEHKRVDGANLTQYPNGAMIISYDDGRMQFQSASGSMLDLRGPQKEKPDNVSAPTEVTTHPDGSQMEWYADGRWIQRYPGGAEIMGFPDGSRIAVTADGQVFQLKLAQDPSPRTTEASDGRHEIYRYGTIITHKDGRIELVMHLGTSLEERYQILKGPPAPTTSQTKKTTQLPQNFQADQVMILQKGITPEQVQVIAQIIVEHLTVRTRAGFFNDFMNMPGVYTVEIIRVRFVLETAGPNDPLYLRSGSKAAPPQPKKESGLKVGFGGLLSGGLSMGGVKIGTGSQTQDVKISDQWGLRKVGLMPYSDPNSAWSVYDGQNKNVLVAVIDSGMDMTHPDGPEYIWSNPQEVPNNGKDDDKNGYIDDIHGWNFLDENNDLTDYRGHGTFVAGIIAAKTNNGIGIAGINPGAVIMPLKVADKHGSTDNLQIFRALKYAADQGAKVINVSLGSRGVSALEQLAVNYAHTKGALIVVACGNDGENIGEYGPASARRVIAVGAINHDGTRSVISNWGANNALLAPGEEVYSLYSKDSDWEGPSGDRERLYYKASGTSFSAPMVTGTASLLLAKNPMLTNVQAEDILLSTATDMKDQGWDSKTGAGLLNAYRALKSAAEGILTVMPTEVIINKDKKKVNSIDVFGVIRGNVDSYTVELGRGKEPGQWEKITLVNTGVVEYDLIARIDGSSVRGGKNWVVRITAKDKGGHTKAANILITLN